MSWLKSLFKSHPLLAFGGLFAGVGLLVYLVIQIINGYTKVDAVPVQEVFDATVEFRSDGPCTATVIGSEKLLTAAHCMDWIASGGNPITIDFSIRGQGHRAKCQRATAFAKLPSGLYRDDLAVCTTTTGGIVGVPYEVVDTTATVQKGDKIVLVGFGCDATNVNELRAGDAVVANPMSAENQIVTDPTGAQSCPGDSGGAVYLLRDDQYGRKIRRLIGVMSDRDYTGRPFVTRIARLARSSLTATQYAATCGGDAAYQPGLKGCRW